MSSQTFAIESYPQRVLVIVPTVFTFLASICVVLRLKSISLSNSRIQASDWLVISALICLWGHWITILIGVTRGATAVPSYVKVSPDARRIFFQTTAARFELWITAVALTQLSILFFYQSIFFVKRRFVYICRATIAVVICWWIAVFVAEILTCRPIPKTWDPQLPGQCFDPIRFCSASCLIHVILDFWILTLPSPLVWKLQSTKTKRFLVTILFSVGVFASICSILRMSCLIQYGLVNGSKLQAFLPELFEILEPAVGICCICMPTILPAVRRLTDSKIALWLRSFTSIDTTRRESSSDEGPSTVRDKLEISQIKKASAHASVPGRSTENIPTSTTV